jgi:sec-independent protein translocase protein TatB
MFDIGSPELLLVAVVAIIVIGPKDLPKAMRLAGYWIGRARGVMRQFRSGFDAMVREAELAEMEKRWASENERIMRAHEDDEQTRALPAPGDAVIEGEAAPPADATQDKTEAEILPPVGTDPAPVMVEKPAIAAEPELPLADDVKKSA